MVASPSSASMQPWCGSKYVIGPELGRGGMATVHFGLLVGDLGFGRVVAIKRIHPRLAEDTEMVAHLRDEARVAARIRHPNVVSVLDVVAAGRELGIVLDYVHGESLSTLLKQGSERGEVLPVAVAVAIVIDVLHGLHAAHTAVDERGEPLHVVHRDISPYNVLVGLDGIARVLDFGVAKAKNRSVVTRDGVVKGRLAYMAPEQLGGDVTERSDLYAVGMVFWELLVGENPFAAAETDTELVGFVLRGVSTAPSSRRAEVPASLDAIVRRALAADENARWASASEMAQALEETGLAATRTAVGDLVSRLAKESVAARSAIVAEIEASSPLAPALPLAPGDNAGVPHEGTSSPPAGGLSSAVTSTDLTAQAVAGSTLDTRRRRPHVRGVAVVAALLVTVTAVVTIVRARAAPDVSTPSPAAASAASIAATAAPHEPSASTSPPSTSTPPSASASAALVLVAPATSGSATTNAAPPSTTRARPAPGRRGGTQRALDCSIPYTVDADGKRRYRRECFEQ